MLQVGAADRKQRGEQSMQSPKLDFRGQTQLGMCTVYQPCGHTLLNFLYY